MLAFRFLTVGAAAAMLIAAQTSPAQTAVGQPTAGPLLVGGELVYPQGAAVPRGLTDLERAYLRDHPRGPGTRTATPPPAGPVRCPGEYEPCDGIVMAWQGLSTWNDIQRQMTVQITNAGDADVYMDVLSAAAQTTVQNSLTAAGANMARVHFMVHTVDTIWLRDYGPRYIFEGDCRAIIDHTYNRPRPNDDMFPVFFSTVKHHARYEIPLVHGGGNFHLDSIGRSYCTRLVDNENPALTEMQIHDLWRAYQNVDTTFFTPYPTSVDSTQHIDMWVQVIGDNAVMVSTWPLDPTSTQAQICDGAAATFASRGYTVYRLPAIRNATAHYTYTNVVMCNNIVLVPTYTNTQVAPYNNQAVTTWQQACPGKTIVPINCEAIVSYAGVMHCIVMHMPRPVGGASPTTYLESLRGGQTLAPGAPVPVTWISDDDHGVTSVDVLLSTDGGATFPRALATGIPDTSSFAWTPPNFYTTTARVKVVVHDADGHTGSDQSPASFTITGCRADFDTDGTVTVRDFLGFLAAYAAGDSRADVDSSGTIDIADFMAFLTGYAAGCA
jgi:agmatine deiminase